MAERRMFAKTIIDSDAFLEMPMSAQALYFHLGMRADDDGFINNPKKIQRMVGASEDDLKLLMAKNFIIPFESGVVVIKHWKIHNYIKADRYKPTVYQEEKAFLSQRENGSYTLDTRCIQDVSKMDTECIQDVSKSDTQVRLGKVRIGQDRLGEVIEESAVAEQTTIDYQSIVDDYNNTCKSLPQVKSLSDARRKAIKARVRTRGIEEIHQAFVMAEQSSFLKGSNKNNWTASFDWIMNDANMAKILDGNYENRTPSGNEDGADWLLRQIKEGTLNDIG